MEALAKQITFDSHLFRRSIFAALIFLYAFVLIRSINSGMAPLLFLMLFQITPFLVNSLRGRQSIMDIILFGHVVNYSLPKYNYYLNTLGTSVLRPGTIAEIRELAICSATMYFFYHLVRLISRRGQPTKIKYEYLVISGLHLFLIVLVLAIHLLPWSAVGSFMQVITAVQTIALAFLFTSKCGNSKIQKWAHLVRILAILYCLLIYVESGFITTLAAVCYTLFIVVLLHRNLGSFIYFSIVALLCFLIQPTKAMYRSTLWNGGENLSMTDRVLLIGNTFQETYFSEVKKGREFDSDLEGLENANGFIGETPNVEVNIATEGLGRLMDESLERVLENTPSKVPFWGWESYVGIVYIGIPRFLWPNKPMWDVWNKFGHRYGYLQPDDNQTCIAFSYLAEGYMAFGYIGLYITAVLFGIAVAFTERIATTLLTGNFSFVYLAFLSPFLPYQLNVSSIVAILIPTFVAALIFRRYFLRLAQRDVYSS